MKLKVQGGVIKQLYSHAVEISVLLDVFFLSFNNHKSTNSSPVYHLSQNKRLCCCIEGL